VQLYKIENDTFTQYFVDENKLKEAIEKNPALGEIDDTKNNNEMLAAPDGLGPLNPTSIEFLQQIAGNKEFWQRKTERNPKPTLPTILKTWKS
jgi:hypothetical protein